MGAEEPAAPRFLLRLLDRATEAALHEARVMVPLALLNDRRPVGAGVGDARQLSDDQRPLHLPAKPAAVEAALPGVAVVDGALDLERPVDQPSLPAVAGSVGTHLELEGLNSHRVSALRILALPPLALRPTYPALMILREREGAQVLLAH